MALLYKGESDKAAAWNDSSLFSVDDEPSVIVEARCIISLADGKRNIFQ